MEKRISYREFQTAKNVARTMEPDLRALRKLEAQLQKLANEYRAVKKRIELFEAGIVETTGFHVKDLVVKVVEPTNAVDKNCKPVMVTKYKESQYVTYDEVKKEYVVNIPEPENVEMPSTPEGNFGSDYDIDKERTEQEVNNPEPLAIGDM